MGLKEEDLARAPPATAPRKSRHRFHLVRSQCRTQRWKAQEKIPRPPIYVMDMGTANIEKPERQSQAPTYEA